MQLLMKYWQEKIEQHSFDEIFDEFKRYEYQMS